MFTDPSGSPRASEARYTLSVQPCCHDCTIITAKQPPTHWVAKQHKQSKAQVKSEWNCFKIPKSSDASQSETTETVKSISLHLLTVQVNRTFPLSMVTNRLNIKVKHKPLSFLSSQWAELLTPIARCLFVHSHFRPRACGGSRVLLANTGCWGAGFCLLWRQASMARWAQYYSLVSSAANLEQGKRRRETSGELGSMI